MSLRLIAPLALLVLTTACPELKLDPNHYACSRDAGEPGQCAEGWHCGVEGYCYELATAGAVKCEPNAGDCAPDWTCGIDGICHVADAGAWACSDDEHCFGWRCGVDGRCVDPSAEALMFDQFPSTVPPPQLENPVLVRRLPERVVTALPYRGTSGEYTFDVHTVVAGEQAASEYRFTRLQALYAEHRVTGDRTVALSPRTHVLQGAPPLDFAATPQNLLWIRDGVASRRLEALAFLEDGGVAMPPPVPVDGNRMAVAEAGENLSVLTFESEGVKGTLIDQQGAEPFVVPRAARDLDAGIPPPTTFQDAEYVGLYGFGGVVVATNRSLHHLSVRPFFFGTFEKDDKGAPAFCELSDEASAAVFSEDKDTIKEEPRLELRTRGSQLAIDPRLLAVKTATPVPGILARDELRLTLLTSGKAPATGTCSSADIPQTVVFGPCPDPCREYSLEVVDFAPVFVGFGDERVEVRCGLPSASAVVRHLLLRKGGFGEPKCVAEPVPLSSLSQDRFRAGRTHRSAAFVGAHGQVHVGENGLATIPVTLSSAPVGVIVDPATREPFALLPNAYSLRAPDAGWAVSPPVTSEPFVAVTSEPPRVVSASGYVVDLTGVGDGGTRGVVATSALPMEEPVRMASATRRDGGTHLLVSSFDQLLGATLQEGQTEPAELEVRLIPFSRTPILGIAPLEGFEFADGGTPLSAGYVVTQSRAFLYHAETDRRWRADELFVPDGDIVTVWVDDAQRGRVGYRDGMIASLPSGLVLAAPLTDSTDVSDFANVCGQPWALARNGLYRLVSGTNGPVGTWERVPLPPPAEPPNAQTVDLGAGRLHADGARLYVFTGHGVVVRFDLTCNGGTP